MLALSMAALGLLAILAAVWHVSWLDSRSRAAFRVAAAADVARERLAAEPCSDLAAGEVTAADLRVRWELESGATGAFLTIRAEQPARGTVLAESRRLVRACPERP